MSAWKKVKAWWKRLIGKLFGDDDETGDGLPENPATPADLPGSISEHWSWQVKDYDNSFRVRWPTAFQATCGAGSYTEINGDLRAEFRSYDTDNGARRPSYTLKIQTLSMPALCVLHDNNGNACAWFRINHTGTQHGTLPR